MFGAQMHAEQRDSMAQSGHEKEKGGGLPSSGTVTKVLARSSNFCKPSTTCAKFQGRLPKVEMCHSIVLKIKSRLSVPNYGGMSSENSAAYSKYAFAH